MLSLLFEHTTIPVVSIRVITYLLILKSIGITSIYPQTFLLAEQKQKEVLRMN